MFIDDVIMWLQQHQQSSESDVGARGACLWSGVSEETLTVLSGEGVRFGNDVTSVATGSSPSKSVWQKPGTVRSHMPHRRSTIAT